MADHIEARRVGASSSAVPGLRPAFDSEWLQPIGLDGYMEGAQSRVRQCIMCRTHQNYRPNSMQVSGVKALSR